MLKIGEIITTLTEDIILTNLPARVEGTATSKTAQAMVHVDDTTPSDEARFDMIMGTDLMTQLQIDISFTMELPILV